MAIVGSRPTAELQLAIMQQDQAVLVSIPGIGKRLAERVIFELKEKVAAAGVAAIGVAGAAGGGEGDVVGALQALGYSLPEAREASRVALGMAGVEGSLEDRVKAALRVLEIRVSGPCCAQRALEAFAVAAVQGEQTNIVEAGGIIFEASNELHGLRNIGTNRATYFVLKFYPHDLAKVKPQ